MRCHTYICIFREFSDAVHLKYFTWSLKENLKISTEQNHVLITCIKSVETDKRHSEKNKTLKCFVSLLPLLIIVVKFGITLLQTVILVKPGILRLQTITFLNLVLLGSKLPWLLNLVLSGSKLSSLLKLVLLGSKLSSLLNLILLGSKLSLLLSLVLLGSKQSSLTRYYFLQTIIVDLVLFSPNNNSWPGIIFSELSSLTWYYPNNHRWLGIIFSSKLSSLTWYYFHQTIIVDLVLFSPINHRWSGIIVSKQSSLTWYYFLQTIIIDLEWFSPNKPRLRSRPMRVTRETVSLVELQHYPHYRRRDSIRRVNPARCNVTIQWIRLYRWGDCN